LGTFARPVALAIVSAVVIVFVRSLVETGHAGFVDAWRGMSRRFWRVVAAQLLAALGVILMAVTIIGIPFAIWKVVGWSFVQQEILFSDRPIRGAFGGSSDLVRGRWWHTARTALFLTLITIVTGPMLTFALILHAIAPVLDQRDRLADLRAPDPVCRAGLHAALPRPRGTRRDRPGPAAPRVAAVAAVDLRPGRVAAEGRGRRVGLGPSPIVVVAVAFPAVCGMPAALGIEERVGAG
jgi:hypothetical protein